jgi:hypothetical protein
MPGVRALRRLLDKHRPRVLMVETRRVRLRPAGSIITIAAVRGQSARRH